MLKLPYICWLYGGLDYHIRAHSEILFLEGVFFFSFAFSASVLSA